MDDKCPTENCPNFIPEGRAAISRRDNKTEICSNCGEKEALEDFARWYIHELGDK
jgi:hypothetical protein